MEKLLKLINGKFTVSAPAQIKGNYIYASFAIMKD